MTRPFHGGRVRPGYAEAKLRRTETFASKFRWLFRRGGYVGTAKDAKIAKKGLGQTAKAKQQAAKTGGRVIFGPCLLLFK
jgi:hypothetical protein